MNNLSVNVGLSPIVILIPVCLILPNPISRKAICTRTCVIRTLIKNITSHISHVKIVQSIVCVSLCIVVQQTNQKYWSMEKGIHVGFMLLRGVVGVGFSHLGIFRYFVTLVFRQTHIASGISNKTFTNNISLGTYRYRVYRWRWSFGVKELLY